jgi:hypothetical protein
MYEMIMKKLLLILCLFSMTAYAEWKFYDGTDSTDAYIDYSKIKIEGRYKSMWVLWNIISPEANNSGKQFKSEVRKEIIDCQTSRTQTVALYNYSEQMGKGEIVYSANVQIKQSNWSNPPPNSFAEGYINIACGRK